VEASLGRIELAREPDFAIGPLEVHPSRREVKIGCEPQILQPRVMQVLVVLAQTKGEVVSRDDLVARCWDGLNVGDDSLNRCILRLRKLAASFVPPPFSIETVVGVGYRLAPGSTEPVDPPDDEREVSHRGRARSVRAAWAVVILAGAAAVAGGIWIARGGLDPRPPVRVLVTILEPLSDDPGVRELARRVSGEVVDTLGGEQIAAVLDSGQAGIAGRNAEVARDFGFLIDGSVHRQYRRFQISARLEDARTHEVLWSRTFVRDENEVADMESEVAARLANVAGMAAFARASPSPLRDNMALAALLEADDLTRAADPDSWATRLALTEQVVQKAPDFAFGHGLLAVTSADGAAESDRRYRSAELAELARREADRALELDPRDAAGYLALALLTAPNDYRAREGILSQGLKWADRPTAAAGALDSVKGNGVLRSVGRLTDALPLIQLGAAIDPLAVPKTRNLITIYADLGRQDTANDLLAKALRRWPNNPAILEARNYVIGFYGSPEARAALFGDSKASSAQTVDPQLAAWRAFLRAGRTRRGGSVTRAAREIIDAREHGAIPDYLAIMMLASLGQTDAAFDLADKLNWRSQRSWFLFSPPTRAMRQDGRFVKLAARLGLVDYWRNTGKWPDICTGPHAELDCASTFAPARLSRNP
jgi:DNA-binding winged helix-turn-helix (wHTH) protein/TolB-like protein